MVRQYDCLKQGGPLEIGARNIPHPAKDYVVSCVPKKVIQFHEEITRMYLTWCASIRTGILCYQKHFMTGSEH